jgi:hypothetical protein
MDFLKQVNKEQDSSIDIFNQEQMNSLDFSKKLEFVKNLRT